MNELPASAQAPWDIETSAVTRWAHRLLLFFYRPLNWPTPAAILALVLLATLGGGWWWLLSGNATVAVLAAAFLLGSSASDAAVLNIQQNRRISALSWKGHLFPLVAARLLAGFVLAVAGIWLGWSAALGLLLGAWALGSALLVRGALVEPRRLALTHLAIASERLAPGSEPLRLLHISDVHIERAAVREAAVLSLAERAAPDLILITGDYANTSFKTDPQTHDDIRAFLGRLSAPHGVYAVMGSPTVDLQDVVPPLFQGTGITLLRDERRRVDLGDGRTVTLFGVDCHHDIPEDAEALAALRPEDCDGGPSVLLYHSPELLHQAVNHGLDLYLCGHTHGGQVRMPVVGALVTFSKLGRRYAMGHYHEGRTHLYVTRGVGFEGLSAPRVRFLCPPEITLVTISLAGRASSPA
jgi:hypothetical protein